jgi:hypothetical protein
MEHKNSHLFVNDNTGFFELGTCKPTPISRVMLALAMLVVGTIPKALA